MEILTPDNQMLNEIRDVMAKHLDSHPHLIDSIQTLRNTVDKLECELMIGQWKHFISMNKNASNKLNNQGY